AKGLFWLATRPEWVGEMSLAGAICRTGPMGLWWAAVPRERWPDDSEWRERLKRNWAPTFGDRRQELVFIGTGLDEAAIRAALDGCLVGPSDPARFDIDAHRSLPDPFPRWGRERAA